MAALLRQVHADPPRHIVTISPDAVLAGFAVAALVFMPFLETSGALLFLLAGGLLCLRHWQASLTACLRHWAVLALPVFCLLSFAWSQYPALSFRFGLQFLVTAVIAVVLATRVSPRLFVRLLFGCIAAAMVASLLFGQVRADTGAWLGIYGSKNALAGAAATFFVIAVSQILDSAASYRYRLLAGFAALLGAMLLMMAQSVSAMAVVPPAILAQMTLLLYHRVTPLQRIVTTTGIGLAALLVAVLAAIHIETLTGVMLEATGKDITLTGRTDLWEVARRLIAERPVLGVGYQAFWVRGHGAAELLWAHFGIDGRSGFNFHNMYLSNAVEIGIAGVLLQVFVLYGAAILTLLWALRTRSAESALLFLMVLVVTLISAVEVPIFFQFSLRSVIVICAFVFAAEALGRGRARHRADAQAWRDRLA